MSVLTLQIHTHEHTDPDKYPSPSCDWWTDESKFGISISRKVRQSVLTWPEMWFIGILHLWQHAWNQQWSPSANGLQRQACYKCGQCQTNQKRRLLLLFSILWDLANTGESCCGGQGGGRHPPGCLISERGLITRINFNPECKILTTWEMQAHLYLSGLSESAAKKLPQTC